MIFKKKNILILLAVIILISTIIALYLVKSIIDQNNQPPVCPVCDFNKDYSAVNSSNLGLLWKARRDEDTEEMMKRLDSLGYLQGYHEAQSVFGVSIYDKDKAYPGLNIYVSGHAPEAYLIDMDGNYLHNWSYQAHPNLLYPRHPLHTKFFRRVFLLNDGSIIVNFEDHALAKLDKNSNLIWIHQYREHHDIDVDEEGNIYSLASKRSPSPWKELPYIRDEMIIILDQDGNMLREVSLLDSFIGSEFEYLLKNRIRDPDIFHSNRAQYLDGSLEHISPLYKKGNVLVSIRNLHVVAIVDMDEKKILWAIDGLAKKWWKRQHESTLTDDGKMVVFDNRYKDLERKSRIIEINPLTEELLWMYEANESDDFFSETAGAQQRLPNGNTLISESNYGRAFEVNKENQIVWEWLSPHRVGDEDELVGTLFHMFRLEDNVNWLIRD